jgi:hypothetical protein
LGYAEGKRKEGREEKRDLDLAQKRKQRGREKRKGFKLREKQAYSFEFKFNRKTNYKTMQCGMKCTRPIFPYISFYG